MGNGTSIGRVRGLGSAHSGAHHWLLQRFTAIGNVILTTWFVVSLLLLPNYNYITVHDWITRPVPATALGLMIFCVFWHARLGVQVMLEDYIHEAGSKFAVIAILNLLTFAGVAFGLLCVIRLALGA
jgi:succinate dehydrogenase / fumarate reductase membrane anchor subunit